MAVELSAVPLMNGERVVGVFGLIEERPDDSHGAPPPHLTPRQVEVLRLLEQGHSTKQIAAELHLSTETVRNHVRRLFRSLGVTRGSRPSPPHEPHHPLIPSRARGRRPEDSSAYCPTRVVSEPAAEELDRDDLANVRCHSTWYFRSRRHAISVGMPLQARHDNSKTIGVEATSTSANAMGGRRYGLSLIHI